ncbi:MAG: hypothetical protein NTV05_01875 [Acidobacteria bacterium]|nr:hypothetical protein [Acidobacteriota bacterium]
MMAPWRPLAFAAALNLTLVVGVTTAQTVMVTKAPRGATIELALNAATIGTATADNTGKATLLVNLSSRGGRTEADVQIFVDVCGTLRRVLLVEPGLQPELPQIGCARRELPGVFLMRQATTMVVEVTASAPAVWLRQGPVPTEWLGEESGSISSKRGGRRPSPTGLILFAGGGLATYRDATAVACGDVTDCTGKDTRLTYAAGVTVWVTQFLGAEASYAKPADVSIRGTGQSFNFKSSLNTTLFTAKGKVALPLGVVRLYLQVGADYHRATSTTVQTHDDWTYTDADGVVQTFTGGTQSFTLRTAGWGLLYGGGIEVWAAPKIGLFAEVERATLKGASRDGDEGRMNDALTAYRIGIRFRPFGK